MGITDRLKDLKAKATDAAAERSDKLHEAVDKVATAADERTSGKYREHIQKAGAKADSLVESLKRADGSSPAEDAGEPDEQPPAAGEQSPPTAGEQSPPAAQQ